MKLHRRSLLLRCTAWTVLILLIGSLASCTIAPSSTIDPPLSTIRVVMDNNYPPYVFEDDQGQIRGILVDQWKLWEERTGVKVDLSALPWGEALQRMKAGEFDVIDTIFYTDERATSFDFTPAYAHIDVLIFFQNNISGIADAGDLKGFRVAVKLGDANADYLVNQDITDLSYYNSYEEIIQAAARREQAIFVIDQPPALYFLYKYGIQDQFNHSAPLYSGAFHRAVKKGNTTVLDLVLDGFSRMNSSEYQAIDRRWLGTSEFNNLQQFVPYLVVGTTIVLLIILALIVFNRMLQKRVGQRTRELEETAAALHDSRHFLADLIEYGGALIFVKDRDGCYELINRKWEEVTGLKREEVIGRTDEVLFPGPVGRQFRMNDLEVIGTGKVLEREEILEDARGKRYFISIKFPLRGKDGHIRGICGMTTEITERKRTEQALEESEEIFQLFMEHSPIYVFFKDAQTRAIRLSKNYEHMLGKSLPELLGKTMDELFPSELARSMMADDLRTLREGKQIEVIEELNGRIYRTTKFPIIKQGHPGWLAGYTIDITEQKQAELALKESERLLNRSQAIAQVGHWMWDTRTNKVTWSDEMYRIFGIDRESFTGNLDDIVNAAIHPDDKERVVKSNEAVLTEQKLGTLEYRVVRPEGLIRYVWAQPGDSVCDETGKIMLLSGVVQDITERKRAEEALRQSEDKFSKAFRTSPDSVNINRLSDGLYLEINDGFTAITGYTPADVAGKTSLELNIWADPADRARLVQGLQEHGQVSNLEAPFVMKDGRIITALMSAAVIEVAGEKCVLSITRDITERKRVEDEVRRLNEDLEQRVLARTRELAEANARLTELDQLKSKFVSDVSHELRTPIANLKLYIDLLERGKPDKQSQYIRVLHQQVRRVAALVDDILDLSRLERRQEQGLIYRAVALNEVVDQIVLAHQPRAEADGLLLIFESASPLPPVRADANQLAQVVTNLVTNALNYTPAGYVRVSTYVENAEVCLRVADSGSGIAAEDLPHIFERFYRGRCVLKNDMPGTGLGLAIVKEIVDLHEGHIEVDSRPGHGTTFRVWLPLASAI